MNTEERMEKAEEVLANVIQSSSERIDRVNSMVERLTAVTESTTQLALKLVQSCDSARRIEDEKYQLMMDFLKEMRETYSQHLQSLEDNRNDCLAALKAEQACTSKLLDKLSSLQSIVLTDIGNGRTTVGK